MYNSNLFQDINDKASQVITGGCDRPRRPGRAPLIAGKDNTLVILNDSTGISGGTFSDSSLVVFGSYNA